jgi:hypothetical protein
MNTINVICSELHIWIQHNIIIPWGFNAHIVFQSGTWKSGVEETWNWKICKRAYLKYEIRWVCAGFWSIHTQSLGTLSRYPFEMFSFCLHFPVLTVLENWTCLCQLSDWKGEASGILPASPYEYFSTLSQKSALNQGYFIMWFKPSKYNI